MREKNTIQRPADPARKKRRRKRVFIALGTIIILLIGLRIALPYIVLHFVNKTLANMKEYWGHVDDVDIHLYRGAYSINDIVIYKRKEPIEGKQEGKIDFSTLDSIPFFKCVDIDASVEWRSIFKGRIVAELKVTEPKVYFANLHKPKKDTDLKGDTSDFRTVIKKIVPIKINRFEVTEGEVHYLDPKFKPSLDIYAHHISVLATNLTNVDGSKDSLPSRLQLLANIYDGKFYLNSQIDPFAKDPTFDVNALLTPVSLVNLNSFTRAYADFDFEKGSLGLFTEFAAKDGEFGGYVKPLIRHVRIVDFSKEEGDIGQVLWEGLLDLGVQIFKNKKKQQVATKLEIKGRFDKPDINIWRAISVVLQNAFLQALRPAIDNTINIDNLSEKHKKTFLEKLFGPKKDKANKNKNKDKKDPPKKKKKATAKP